jgi:hypothetical protein
MIACACKEIVMGKQSNLGPIDPQFNGIPAHGIVEEFRRAHSEIQKAFAKAKSNPNDANSFGVSQATMAVWQPIIAKYNPTLIGNVKNQLIGLKKWLQSGYPEICFLIWRIPRMQHVLQI